MLAAAHSSGQVAETTEEETGEKSNGSSTASPGESKIEDIKASHNSIHAIDLTISHSNTQVKYRTKRNCPKNLPSPTSSEQIKLNGVPVNLAMTKTKKTKKKK